MTRGMPVTIAAAISLAPLISHAAAFEFVSQEGGFKVTFPLPAPPTRTSKIQQTLYGPATVTMWSQERKRGDSAVTIAGYAQLPPRTFASMDTDQILDSSRDGGLAGVQATCGSNCKVTLVAQQDYRYSDLPARLFIMQITAARSHTFMRYDYILDAGRQRSYSLICGGASRSALDSPEATSFRNSFQLLRAPITRHPGVEFASQEGGFAVTFPLPVPPTRTTKVINGVYGTGTLTMWSQDAAFAGYSSLPERALLRATPELFDSSVGGAIANARAMCKTERPECTISMVVQRDYSYARDLPARFFISRLVGSESGFQRFDFILDRPRRRMYTLGYTDATQAGLDSTGALAFRGSFRLLK